MFKRGRNVRHKLMLEKTSGSSLDLWYFPSLTKHQGSTLSFFYASYQLTFTVCYEWPSETATNPAVAEYTAGMLKGNECSRAHITAVFLHPIHYPFTIRHSTDAR